MNELLLWLRDLVNWLREAVGGGVSSTFHVAEHLKGLDGECEAWLIGTEEYDCGIPGMTACWYIRRNSASKDFILLCFNIAQIKEAYKPAGDGYLPDEWRRKFEVNARLHLKLQKNVGGSHLFMVCSVQREPATVKFTANQAIEYKSIDCESCFSVDLQGASVAWMGANGSAIKIVRAVAERVLQIPAINSRGYLWEQVILSLSDADARHTWLTWLNYFCREYRATRIDAEHILQPPIGKAYFQRKRAKQPKE
jgi:hypothetical protein